MKKLISISFAFLLLGANLVLAKSRQATVPTAQTGDPVYGATYAGVEYATATTHQSTTNVLIFAGEGVLIGFVTSSGSTTGDHVVFRSTNTLLGVTNNDSLINEVVRVGITTATTNGVLQNGFSYRFPEPIWFRNGCAGRIVSQAAGAAIHSITYLFNKFGN